MAIDPFLTISAKDISFIKIEIGIEIEVGIVVEVGIPVELFPAISCIWVDIWSIFSLILSNFFCI